MWQVFSCSRVPWWPALVLSLIVPLNAQFSALDLSNFILTVIPASWHFSVFPIVRKQFYCCMENNVHITCAIAPKNCCVLFLNGSWFNSLRYFAKIWLPTICFIPFNQMFMPGNLIGRICAWMGIMPKYTPLKLCYEKHTIVGMHIYYYVY